MPSPLPILVGVGLLLLVASSSKAATSAKPRPGVLGAGAYEKGYAVGYADGVGGEPEDLGADISDAAKSSGNASEFAKGYADGYAKGLAAKSSGGTAVTPPAGTTCPPALKDASGTISTTSGASCADPSKPSNPAFQWTYTVKPGDNPSAITQYYLGGDGYQVKAKGPSLTKSWDYAYCELIAANAAAQGTVGERTNPRGRVKATGAGDVVVPPYNFKRLVAGDVLKIPMSWNPWVSETGKPKGTSSPF